MLEQYLDWQKLDINEINVKVNQPKFLGVFI